MRHKEGLIEGFKGMAEYFEKKTGITLHPDTFRKAVDDKENPLCVDWENGRAYIKPRNLIRWRNRRRGRRRRVAAR